MNTITPRDATLTERSARTRFVPNVLDWIALVLTIVGGIHWELAGVFRFNLKAAIFGGMTTICASFRAWRDWRRCIA